MPSKTTSALPLSETLPRYPSAFDGLALALAVAMLPHALNQPPWVMAVALLGLLARVVIMRRGWPLPGRMVLSVFAMALTAAVFWQYGTLMGRDAGVALLLVMTGLKLLETRSLRDAMLAVFLGYFVVITNFFYTQEIPIALYMLLAVFVTTAALIRLNGGTQPPPWSEAARFSGLLLLQAMPLMLILFVLFPRLPGPLWAMPDTRESAKTGLSDSMSPGSISELLQSNAPALRASFAEEPPPPIQRYWRGPVFWHYDGRQWRRGEGDDIAQSDTVSRDFDVSYTVTLEPHDQRWLLALDVPVRAPDQARLTADDYLLAQQPVRRLLQYTAYSRLSGSTETVLSEARRERALQLPPRTAPQARNLARQWRNQHGTDDAAIIQAALQYFREQPFFYTLQPPSLPGDPVDQFLFQTRRGFCEHYTSSFVVLMRAAGIPARVVTGYQGGEWNRTAGYLLVRQSDAHAWAEIWQADQGWVRIDPTSAVAPERIEQGIRATVWDERDSANIPAFLRAGAGWVPTLRLQWDLWRDSVNYYWNGWVLAFGPERQAELLQRLGFERMDWRGMVSLMAGLIGLTVLVFLLGFLWRNRPPRQDPLARIYRRFCQRIARIGIHRQPHEGPWDFAQRITQQHPALSEKAQRFTRQYVALRYGPQPDPQARNQLRRILREF
ncbi:transglutaminase TgpA family protein [Thiorhodospira sibirica]|uniref:transglutaminase TgpA family protein n=1 Tax=Thiorhodospira sibirica TaxID=154347 RepID=UPI00022C52AC|nr:DUF3488 and transglutaminase-like domain-containing protein [Thiorhodospira sibirica]